MKKIQEFIGIFKSGILNFDGGEGEGDVDGNGDGIGCCDIFCKTMIKLLQNDDTLELKFKISDTFKNAVTNCIKLNRDNCNGNWILLDSDGMYVITLDELYTNYTVNVLKNIIFGRSAARALVA